MMSRALRSCENVGNNSKRYLLKIVKRCAFVRRSTSVMESACKEGEVRAFIVAAEVSGDTLGSRLMASLKTLSPTPIRFSGVGGRSTVEAAILVQPHVVVTVDSKGFSFHLLKQRRARYGHERLDGPVHFHYVAPSFWAWKGGEERLKGVADFVDHVLCILPNEDSICKTNGLAATFVGHPILEDCLELNMGKENTAYEWKIEFNSEDFRSKHAIPSGATVISVLPGSRLQEVIRMLPIFANTMKRLTKTIHELTTVIHVAPNQDVENYIRKAIHNWHVPAILIPGGIQHLRYDAFSASRFALCTSGTVALELQLARLPCVVAYRAHLITEWFTRYKAKIPHVSLPNILMNSAIIPEALFQACTPTTLASLLMELMHDAGLQEKQTTAAGKVLSLFYPSERVMNNLV